ncbi:M48 family metallopeptidase [Pseudaestuariivita atlantica]|uniref:Peptidase M48 n=1 Tax=Pseudaestuariivita atlantica TaxID=1317121 RepID=A0A0L1JPC3_9RHOB|nr:M48 family metallopeptidase [Pseudaestuariivita atlantica]KNG93620.1 peptidase M48 [Pseudaestuariivita atlantica]
MSRLIAVLATLAVLAGCEVVPVEPADPKPKTVDEGTRAVAVRAARQFVSVVETVEPVAEKECRARTKGVNCDFLIVVDDRPGQPPNAFQTLDRSGRPVIAFNLALIADARNADELAFIMGHETAHHIRGHIARAQRNANAGAVVLGGLTALSGGSEEAIKTARDIGAVVGARRYSKEFELEADRLGTIITLAAGYDPIKGAAYFFRIPDPGDRFLGTHPPNAARREIVRRTVAEQTSS